MSQDDVSIRLKLAVAAAREAGGHTLRYFGRKGLHVERKDDNSPVTVADREAEQLLRDRIQAQFPSDAIVGEELDDVPGESEFRWILDPIDGTKSFISGVPLYGTLVGVERRDRSVIGVVYMPGLDEMVYASSGGGAWHARTAEDRPEAARVSSCDQLDDALFVTTQVDSFARREAEAAYTRLQDSVSITRTWGDCYGYLLVATGRAHLMIDPIMNLWDAAAIQPIMEEAGGVFVDWQGQATTKSGEGVATSEPLLSQVMAILGPFAKPA